jgi:hypothetical protein
MMTAGSSAFLQIAAAAAAGAVGGKVRLVLYAMSFAEPG